MNVLLECVQLLRELIVDYSYLANTAMKSPPFPPEWDLRSQEPLIFTHSYHPLPYNSNTLEEVIRQVFKSQGYQLPLLQESDFVVEIAHSRSPMDIPLELLKEILKILESPRMTYGHYLFGRVHPYDRGQRKLESLNGVTQSWRLKKVDTQRGHDLSQIHLLSIKKLKNAVKTDLRKYQIYLTGLKSRLRGLERRAATVTKDLERANLELVALKQDHCNPEVRVGKGESCLRAVGHLTCQPVLGNHQDHQRIAPYPVCHEQYQNLKYEEHLTQYQKHSCPPGKGPSARRINKVQLKSCMLQCQVQIDVLMEQVNKQINTTEIDISATKNLIQIKKTRRSENRKHGYPYNKNCRWIDSILSEEPFPQPA
ncbi:kinetochore protein NDC80 homolog [Pelobates fuscus]|uniref:kinetochore protein NDC80 homolog n=1 Tax=Pelobates fuscus TaxID=191477 RepID=UPI002FE4D9F7